MRKRTLLFLCFYLFGLFTTVCCSSEIKVNPFANVKVGDIVKMGNFPQTAKGEKKPIEWKVLAKSDNRALVISLYGLAVKRFDSSSAKWKNSEICKWLNCDFYNSTFTDIEKGYIDSVDFDNDGNNVNVFLLSSNELKYFSDNYSRICIATPYAVKNGAFGNGYDYWWLRSYNGAGDNYASCVDNTGYTCGFPVNDNRVLARPVLLIKL